MKISAQPFGSAFAGMRWSLGPNSSPPLYYESLDRMQQIRGNDYIEYDFVKDIPNTVETLFSANTDCDPNQRHFGLISLALLLLGNDFTDECHDLITPLSWPESTYFGYGPSVYSKVSPEAKSLATYVHCLVHRKEAFHVGEFGTMGFQNGNYWSNSVARLPGSEFHLPHAELLTQVQRVADDFSDCAEARDWIRRHHISTTNYFESRAVHELCADVLQNQLQQSATERNEKFRSFGEKVAETELRVLLRHAVHGSKMGLRTRTIRKPPSSKGRRAAVSLVIERAPVSRPRTMLSYPSQSAAF